MGKKEGIYQVIGEDNYPKVIWEEMGKGKLVVQGYEVYLKLS